MPNTGPDHAEGMQQDIRTSDGPITPYVSDRVIFVSESSSLRDAAERLRANDVGLVAVGNIDNLHGVVSERDIVTSVALGFDLDETTVAQVETDDLVWATTDSTVGDVAEEMMEHYIRHMLIRDDAGGLAGVVSMRDLLTAFLN